MATSKYILHTSIILGIYFLLSSSSCKDYCHKELLFEIPITISPAREVYNKGDSIWVDIQIADVLKDVITGDSITVGYFDFETGFTLRQYTEENLSEAINHFSFFFVHGSHEIRGGTFKQSWLELEVRTENHIQHGRFAIILDDITGDFGIYFGSNQDGGTGVKYFPEDNCDYVFDMKFLTNGGSTENIERYIAKYPNMPDYLGIGFTVEKFRDIGTYFFTVE